MILDHEKLDVYQLELQFITWASVLLDEAREVPRTNLAEACDHLDRASLSALFNTAEGHGKRRRQIRARFFDDARGSATECAACLDALVAKGAVSKERIEEGKGLLVRIVGILTKLIQLYEDDMSLKEEALEYGEEPQATNVRRLRGRGRGRGTRTMKSKRHPPFQRDLLRRLLPIALGRFGH